jgi:hypothetical protein
MDLVNTDVEIRERSLSQRVDLALRFVGTRGLGVIAYAAIGVVPAMLFNAVLLWVLDPFHAWNNLGWAWSWAVMTYLIWIESPIVMAPLIVYLGATLFRQPISWRLAIREVWLHLFQQLFIHGVVRIQFLWCGLVLLSYAGQLEELLAFSLFMGMLAVMFFWSFRPYVDQIVFLERLPVMFQADHPMTVGKRSSLLHGSDVGRILAESMVNVLLAMVVFFATYSLFLWSYYWMTFNTVTQDWFSWSLFALAWWCAMILATVLRFLGYLDVRILSEGWELELRMRREAEAQQAAGAGRAKSREGRAKVSVVSAEGQR